MGFCRRNGLRRRKITKLKVHTFEDREDLVKTYLAKMHRLLRTGQQPKCPDDVTALFMELNVEAGLVTTIRLWGRYLPPFRLNVDQGTHPAVCACALCCLRWPCVGGCAHHAAPACCPVSCSSL